MFSPNSISVSYNLIKLWRACFLFLLENSSKKTKKQLVYFDHQNENSCCLFHHYVNSSCWFCVSTELQKHDFKPISAWTMSYFLINNWIIHSQFLWGDGWWGWSANILSSKTSNFQGATIRPIVQRHKHCIFVIVHW